MLFLRGDVVTHAGVYLREQDAQVPPPFRLDIEFESIEDFYGMMDSAGLHYVQVENHMNGDGLSVLRILESGVVVVFDAEGALSHVASEPIRS